MNKKILIGILIGIVIVGSFILINYWKSQKIKVCTDKSVYFSEPIELTIKSGLDKPVFITPTFSIRIEVEDDQISGEKWRPLKTIVGTGCNCFLNLKCDEKGFTIPPQIKINPHSFYNLSLNPDCFFEKNKKYRIQVMPSIQIGKGKFKDIGFYYSNEFLVKEPQVTIETDKTEYEQGEIIKIAVKNNLDKPIWYRRQIPSEFPPFWELEKFEENKWKTVYFYLPVQEKEKEICIFRFHERPTWYIDELKPNSKIFYQWNQRVCLGDKDNSSEPEFIQKGRYRFAFRFGLRKIHLSNYQEEPWKGKEDLMDTKIIYSNEFIIKEKSEGVLSDTEPPSTLLLIIPEKNQRGDFIELTGRIYSMGNPPVIQLGVETLDGEVYGIVGKRTKELWKFRDKALHLKGYLAGRTPRTEKSIEVTDYRSIK